MTVCRHSAIALVALAVASGSRPGFAQTGPKPAAEPTSAGATAGDPSAPGGAKPEPNCFPACRAGYLCHDGECISMCNPPCDSGQVCVDGSRCELESARSGVYEPPPPPPPPEFANRAHSALAFHLGFGGDVEANGQAVDLASTLGFNIRADFPVVRYLLLGPLFQFGAWKADVPDSSRSYYVDIDLFVRGRVPIQLDSVALQVWGGFPVGFTLDFLSDTYPNYDGLGLGWNIGVLVGGAIHFSKKFGMFAEIGWLQHKVSHDGETSGDLDLRLSQGNFNVGFVFAN